MPNTDAPALLPSQTTEFTEGPVTLVGISRGSIEIPLLVFGSRTAAVAFLTDAGVTVPEGATTVAIDYDALAPDLEATEAAEEASYLANDPNDTRFDFSVYPPLTTALFGPNAYYDDDNGNIGEIEFRPFTFGSPLARGFNLD